MFSYSISQFPGSKDYAGLIAQARVFGTPVASRYGETLECPPLRVRVQATDLVGRRWLNRDLGWMELLQLLAGVFDPDAIARVAPKADLSLFTPAMAYGPRLKGQIPAVIQALADDPNTREAVLFVGHPDNGPTPDQPCTSTIQLLRRRERLNAVVTMRSWDLLKGLPYDLVMFGGLVQAVAACLGIPPGVVTVNAGCPHVYLADVLAGRLPAPCDQRFELAPGGLQPFSPVVHWAALAAVARALVPSARPKHVGEGLITTSEVADAR